ncbi:MAG TPA: hypothetical protein VM577_18750 [Anaerovoracaceae bacterium]|nr:hypothetical protein [Anaerovoracaceae bacterium]
MKRTVDVTDEEMRLLMQIREQKAQDEAAAKAAAEKAANKVQLEAKFREAMTAGHAEIKQHINAAKMELNLAVQASEKHGVPFTSGINELRSRRYVPASFRTKWADADQSAVRSVLEDFDIYIGSSRETGWEYWNTSSLSC